MDFRVSKTDVFPGERALFARLASSQTPEALFLTCSDSRIVPDCSHRRGRAISSSAAMPATSHRPMASTPEASPPPSSTRYSRLGVRDIVVCGHSDCGAMKGLLHPEKLAGLPTMAAWLHHGERARFITEESYGRPSGAFQARCAHRAKRAGANRQPEDLSLRGVTPA